MFMFHFSIFTGFPTVGVIVETDEGLTRKELEKSINRTLIK